MRHTAIASLGLLALVATFLCANTNEPYLVALRGVGHIGLVAVGIAVPFALIRIGHRRGTLAGRVLIVLWLVPVPAFACAQLVFQLHKHHTLSADETAARWLGRHFIVGYASADEAGVLAAKGLITGVYITRHNVAGRAVADVRTEIASLQARRQVAGLPPLIVAADQEGGIVSHLSPPLSALPALSTFAALSPDLRRRKAEEEGQRQGSELAGIGVNLDLAPVVDLRPPAGRVRFDFNTLIGQRAISDDPEVVADVARAYVQGLEATGVGAVVKHFPGLGRVQADTHHFTATLDAPIAELEATDWRPFREVLADSTARLMVGHVALAAIDPDRPASHSRRVIDGLIRGTWHYQGVVMTDDLVMGAIYGGNVCNAVVEALNAGADLLLVAYDGAQFYRIFDCALDAYSRGRLDLAMLRASDERLAPHSRERYDAATLGPLH